jgi:hypothetical protein
MKVEKVEKENKAISIKLEESESFIKKAEEANAALQA